MNKLYTARYTPTKTNFCFLDVAIGKSFEFKHVFSIFTNGQEERKFEAINSKQFPYSGPISEFDLSDLTEVKDEN